MAVKIGDCLTAREKHLAYTHLGLSREAKERFPRSYVADELHDFESKELCQDKAHDLIVALARRHKHYLVDGDVATAINTVAPDDCQVVGRGDFDDMRTWAIASWKLLDEIISATKSATDDPYGKIIDLIRDAERFDKQFRAAQLNMPDVVENAE